MKVKFVAIVFGLVCGTWMHEAGAALHDLEYCYGNTCFDSLADAEAAMRSSAPCASELELTSIFVKTDGRVDRMYSVPPRDAEINDDFYSIVANASGACDINLPILWQNWCGTIPEAQDQMHVSAAEWDQCIVDHQPGDLTWKNFSVYVPPGSNPGDPFYASTSQANDDGCEVWMASIHHCPVGASQSGCRYYKAYESTCDVCRTPSCTGCPNYPADVCRNPLTSKITERLHQGDECSVGNPCIPSSGAKVMKEFEFSFGGFDFNRYYNSRNQAPNTAAVDSKWFYEWGSTVSDAWAGGWDVGLLTTNQTIDVYKRLAAGVYTDVMGKGSILKYGGNTWTLEYVDGRIFEYDTTGRLSRLRIAHNPKVNVAVVRDFRGRAAYLEDVHGRRVEIKYDDAQARIVQIVLPSVPDSPDTIDLAYDASGVLQTVSRSDGSERTYTYGDPLHPGHLTSITDELGIEYSEYHYDSAGRVIFSGSIASEPEVSPKQYAGSVSLDYAGDVTSVTDAYGEVRTYTYEYAWQLLYPKLASVADSTETILRDFDPTTGKLVQKTDGNGHVTTYAYVDAFLRETSREEAMGTPEARRMRTQWDSDSNRVLERRVESIDGLTQFSRQSFVYNSRGQILTSTQTDPVTLATRTTTYAYCEAADVALSNSTCPFLGLVKSVDGPRTDVSDITTYTYYPATDESGCASTGPCHRKGDLWKVTNALGHVSETLRYDQAGRVRATKDANGVTTDFTYHPRGWLLTRTVKAAAKSDNAITTYTYDAIGQVTRITQPDGDFLDYEYDAAHRLTAIEDALGNRIDYTLDAAGHRTAEVTKDANAAITRQLTRVYDQLGRLDQQLDAQNRPTDFGYDANGNQTNIEDALGVETQQHYDPLDRLKTTIQDYAGLDVETGYTYDALDRLVTVTDPKGLATDYTYDGLGNLTQLDSPDTGITTYTYDAAGNRLTQTDARNITATHAYDALNRLAGISYPTTSLNVTFQYDQADGTTGCIGSFPKGRLTRMLDASGTTTHCYDRRGNLMSKRWQAAVNLVFTTSYTYTRGDRLASIINPNNITVSYTRDALGRIVSLGSGKPLVPIVTDVDYLPFGPVHQITFAGGSTQGFTYDANYWTEGVAGTALNLDFDLDATGNIVAANDPSPAHARSYAYDPLARLTGIDDGNAALIEAYTYDGTGNRLTKQTSGGTQTYGYPIDSHHLASIDAQSRWAA